LASGEALKVGKATPTDQRGRPGEVIGVIRGKGPVVACGQGALILEKVKPAGKGWMDGFSLCNGGKVAEGDLLGQAQN
jgi:methionyl-tRNA formyltransferase